VRFVATLYPRFVEEPRFEGVREIGALQADIDRS
jgi:hypothetical protein